MPLIKAETPEDFDKAIKSAGNNLVIIDFFATWCGPCKVIGPIFQKLSDENPNVYFISVDVEQCEEVAGKYGVSCMPTFVFIKDGNKVDEFSGANEEKLRACLTKFV